MALMPDTTQRLPLQACKGLGNLSMHTAFGHSLKLKRELLTMWADHIAQLVPVDHL